MCEFCTEHGEGKTWYLQMKNYSDELLYQDLTASQKSRVKAATRYEWANHFWEFFILPAITGNTCPEVDNQVLGSSPQASEEEIMAQRKLEHFGQVLPIEDVERVIDMASSITRMPCGCRFLTTGKTDKRYCFGLGLDKWDLMGHYPEAAASLEVLEKPEAKQYFRKYDQEGLVHSIWTGVTPYVIGLCNCDHDCGAYKAYIELRGSPRFFRAEYFCQVDWDLCMGCKACMSQCQFGAMFYSSALGKVTIDPQRCFGCGVCRAECAYEAIELTPRRENPKTADLWLGDASR